MEHAGFCPTLVNEIDTQCCDTIRRNRPDLQLVDQSIADLTADKLYSIRSKRRQEVT